MVYQNLQKTSTKGGAIAPPFCYQDLILAIAASIYAGGGFGEKIITETACFTMLILILVNCRRWMIPLALIIIIACTVLPALIQSPFLISALLLYHKKPCHAILVLTGSALQLCGGINPFYLPLFLIPMVLIIVLKANWGKVHTPAVAILAIINLLPAIIPYKTPLAHQGFAFPYKIDSEIIAPDSKSGTTYSSIDDQGNRETAEILVLEHDPPHGFATCNWSQKRLWFQNQYYGTVLLRIATSLDGYVYSNIGCQVNNDGLRLLGEAHQKEHNSFISKSSGKLIFSDSDFLTNAAIGYQAHLARSLFCRFSLAHGILFGTVISCLLVLSAKGRNASIILLAVTSIAACGAINTQRVDVRVVANHALWPHSNGVGGIASEVERDREIKTIGRTGHARILAIGRDASATHNHEKVIVMEGSSRVKIGSTWYEALDLPQGEVDGIIDAIPIRQVDGNVDAKCKQLVNGAVLIGTNSARKNSKVIYDASR